MADLSDTLIGMNSTARAAAAALCKAAHVLCKGFLKCGFFFNA